MHKLIKKFGYAVSGVWYALRSDFSFRTQTWMGVLVLGAVYFFFQPLSQTEMLFAAVAFMLILTTELQNTALETALNRVHPELHDQIGRSKDMAAGAVLLSGLFALLVIAVIAHNHLI